jgi:hypothetical protein
VVKKARGGGISAQEAVLIFSDAREVNTGFYFPVE